MTQPARSITIDGSFLVTAPIDVLADSIRHACSGNVNTFPTVAAAVRMIAASLAAGAATARAKGSMQNLACGLTPREADCRSAQMCAMVSQLVREGFDDAGWQQHTQ